MDPATHSRGIGGTDIAAILGMHPQKQAWDVYADKAGLLERCADVTNSRMTWGKKLERLIAEAWSEVTRKPYRWLDQTMRSERNPLVVWTPDAESCADPRGIDCKNVAIDQRQKWGESGTDDVPQHIHVQAQWYMMPEASGLPAWDIAVLFGGNDFRIYTVEADAEIQAVLIEEAEKFWREHVETGVAPPISTSDAAAAYLRSRFPKNLAGLRQASAEELSAIYEYLPAREAYDAAEERKKALENRIKEAIGDAEGLQFDGGRITWKKTKDGLTTDWEAIAKEAGADEQLIQKWTITKPGYRRLYVSAK